MKLRHIAVFTEDMKKSVEFYQTLGGKAYAEALLDIGGGKTKKLVHMVFEGEGTVELVEPGSREMMPAGAGICEHFCFAVKDVDEEFSRLKSFGPERRSDIKAR